MPSYPLITSRRIKYDSPSGYVNIGKYIPPFEKTAGGFGFKGVLVEDAKSGRIQCHVCGVWLEQLSMHLKAHKLTAEEYKRNYGLLQTTALKSKRLRLIQSKVMIDLRKKYKQCNRHFERNNVEAGNRKGKPKANEHQNKYGVCDLQIFQKVSELYQELKKTPSLIDLKNRYGGGFVTLLAQRYGSYVKYCREHGYIPLTSNNNPKYSRQYFIDKCKDKEASIRIFTISESRNLYHYFKGGIKELRDLVKKQSFKDTQAQDNMLSNAISLGENHEN